MRLLTEFFVSYTNSEDSSAEPWLFACGVLHLEDDSPAEVLHFEDDSSTESWLFGCGVLLLEYEYIWKMIRNSGEPWPLNVSINGTIDSFCINGTIDSFCRAISNATTNGILVFVYEEFLFVSVLHFECDVFVQRGRFFNCDY